MKQVAKLVIEDADNQYLLLFRNNHPKFGNDVDLPGGTSEEGESILETMIREVREETGIIIKSDQVQEVYSGIDYSLHETSYALFRAKLDKKPDINLSWEHSSYKWLERNNFLKCAKLSKDAYMQMVYAVLQ